MSRARVAVLQIVSKQLTVTEAAAGYGISRRHLHRLLARYREGGLDALEPRSRRPKTTPIATPETVRQRVIELRGQLTADGLNAGPPSGVTTDERFATRAIVLARACIHGRTRLSAQPSAVQRCAASRAARPHLAARRGFRCARPLQAAQSETSERVV